ncbi:hypothetical protein EsH8_VIII_000006 [Colletotrichum jinshuiense]
MKLSITALVSILPAMSWACATYQFCLCGNSDGSFHEDATKKMCKSKNGTYMRFDDGRHYCIAGVANAGIAGAQPLLFNNCAIRKMCNNYGSTGDSNCWGKTW